MKNIGNLLILLFQGENAEAESLFARSLEIRKQAFGDDHPAVAESLQNRALLLVDQVTQSSARLFIIGNPSDHLRLRSLMCPRTYELVTLCRRYFSVTKFRTRFSLS